MPFRVPTGEVSQAGGKCEKSSQNRSALKQETDAKIIRTDSRSRMTLAIIPEWGKHNLKTLTSVVLLAAAVTMNRCDRSATGASTSETILNTHTVNATGLESSIAIR